jgi:TonB family protein
MLRDSSILVAVLLGAACGSAPGRPATSANVETVPSERAATLDAKPGKYIVFFKHVKQRVNEALRCPDSSGVPADATRTGQRWQSRVHVIMGTDGAVQRAFVDVSSGRDDVDQAALSAMKRAGPFSGPPRELFQSDGTAEFRFGVECGAAQPGR